MSKKGKRRKANDIQVKVGEIIEIKSLFGMPAAGIYRVDAVAGDLFMLSAGEIRAGVSKDFVEITGRNLPEPESWHAREIEILGSTACDCPQCLQLLAEKKALFANISGVEQRLQ